MSAYTDEELSKYIWANYRLLIEQESDFLSMIRAFSAHSMDEARKRKFLLEKDWKYLEWPLERLKAELAKFDHERNKQIALEVAQKYADQISLNTCSNCGRLVIAPSSEHCLHCRHSWHSQHPHRSGRSA